MSDIFYTRGSGYLETFLAKRRAEEANRLISEKLRSGRILDIGCGSYPYFLLNTKFNEKFGLDPSLKLTKISDKSLNLKTFDVSKNKLPFKDNFFNTVTMLAVFEHIDENKIYYVLNEIKRVLKKNGLFLITTPAPWSDKLLHQMSKVGLISSEEIHEHKTHYSKQKIASLINKSGFTSNNIKSGFFEFYMNMWFTAIK